MEISIILLPGVAPDELGAPYNRYPHRRLGDCGKSAIVSNRGFDLFFAPPRLAEEDHRIRPESPSGAISQSDLSTYLLMSSCAARKPSERVRPSGPTRYS